MSSDFFRQLVISEPDISLEVDSASPAEQTVAIMISYERVLLTRRSSLCLVVGDVTSTMACAIVTQKLNIPVTHVEAGIRSGDWSVPEEINRLMTDSISNWFFTTSITASNNLTSAGIDPCWVFFFGNTMIDALLGNIHRLRIPDFWNQYNLNKNTYLVLTLHRPSNVDIRERFFGYLIAISTAARDCSIVCPVHPRTMSLLVGGTLSPNLCVVKPQPYLVFNYLVKHALAVITDSGGVTEESTVLGVPCFTLRDSTERPEAVTIGTNELIGTNYNNIKVALDKLFLGNSKKWGVPEKWDGRTGEHIVGTLEHLLQ